MGNGKLDTDEPNSHLLRSFENHVGERGVHFYTPNECNFLPWDQVIAMIKRFSGSKDYLEFEERLITLIANYDPDTEFIALCQSSGDKTAIETYAKVQ